MARITRETLYEQIWEQPMTTVAKQYDVSSNYLARICEQLKIPRPNRGYWAKQVVGQKVRKMPLPELDPGDDTTWDREGHPYYLQRPPVPTYAPSPAVRRRNKRLATHPLVLDVKELFEDSQPSKHRDDGYLKPKSGALPDMFVAARSLSRALKLANTLYLKLEDRGHWVRTAANGFGGRGSDVDVRATTDKPRGQRDNSEQGRSWRPRRPTLVFIGGVAIGLTIFEIAEDMPAIFEDFGYRRATAQDIKSYSGTESWRVSQHSLPCGRLGVFAYSPYGRSTWVAYWREDKSGTIGQLIDQIVIELEAAAPIVAELEARGEQEEQERQRQYEEAQKKRRKEAFEAAERKAQKQSAERLLSIIDGWVTARHVELFLTELGESSANLDESSRAALLARLEVARTLFGGTVALNHFARWSTPEELFETPPYW